MITLEDLKQRTDWEIRAMTLIQLTRIATALEDIEVALGAISDRIREND